MISTRNMIISIIENTIIVSGGGQTLIDRSYAPSIQLIKSTWKINKQVACSGWYKPNESDDAYLYCWWFRWIIFFFRWEWWKRNAKIVVWLEDDLIYNKKHLCDNNNDKDKEIQINEEPHRINKKGKMCEKKLITYKPNDS